MERSWRVMVGVVGAAECDVETADLAEEVGRRVAERGAVLLTGGRGGVMEAACRGAHQAGGLTIGVLPGRDAEESRPNPEVDVAIFTGLGNARNYVNICASEVLIALPGSWGTLSEIALARKAGRWVVLLPSRTIDPEDPQLLGADTAQQAVDLAFDLLAKT